MKKTIRNTHREAYHSTKKIKVMVMFIFFTLLLIGTVSAVEWNDKLTYSDNDLKVSWENWWGLGKTIGTAKLTSHVTVDEIRIVMAGKDRIVMFYDFDFAEGYTDGLGEVEFRDMKSGRLIGKNYYFTMAIFENITIEDYDTVCINKNYNGTDYEDCSKIYLGNHIEEQVIRWDKLKDKDIPQGKVRIGLVTDVNSEDHIDGVWTIAGKKITRHAQWNAVLREYYEASGSSNGMISWGVNWEGMSFKVGNNGTNENFNMTEIGLKLYRVGSPGAMTIHFRVVNETTGLPTGADLLSNNSISGNSLTTSISGEWYNFTFGGGLVIDASTTYAVIESNAGNADANSVRMNYLDPSTYGGWGERVASSDSGSTWGNQSGRGIAFRVYGLELTENPVVTLNSPIDSYNSSNSLITFNGTAYDNIDLVNVSLIIDSSYNQTNSSGLNNSNYIFNKVLADGNYNWTYEACDNESLCTNATTRTFTVDTGPVINVFSPTNNSNFTTSTIFFNATSSLAVNTWIVNYNGTNATLTDINTSLTVEDGNNFQLLLYANNSATGVFGLNDSIFFSVDANGPFINITHPTETVSYHEVNTNLTINWTVSDLNLDVCIFEFKGVNRTVNCLDNSTEINITNNVNSTVIFYANDTSGNSNSTSKFWNYTIFEHSRSYELSTMGGSTEDFELNVTKDSSLQISTVSLVYNLSASTATFTSGDNPIISKSLDIPNPDSDTNFSFYFSFTLSDSQIINTSSKNQTVLNFGIGNCSAFSVLIYNFTLLDEENQTQLSNVTIDYAFNLFDKSRTTQIANFSLSSTVNPTAICVNQNLTTSTFSLDGTLKYISTDSSNYLTRYYNILNFSLMNSSIPNNINLYDVIDTTATPFQLTFRDNFLVLTPNILVNVNKQFVLSNDFKTVEIPITDTNGQTILNLVRNTAVYNLIFIDLSGNIVASFSRINAFCQDFTIGECTLNLDASSTITKTFNLSESTGISYTLEYVNSTSTATFTFNSIDSTAITARIIGTTQNQFGNQTVCDNSLTSTLGTLTCNASSILATDNYLFIDVFSDGNYVTTQIININPANPLIGGLFGTNGYFIAFFMLLLIIIFFSEDKQVLLIMLGMGWAAILIFGLIKGAIIGSVSGGIWLLVSIITMIWKLKKEEVPG